MFKLRNKKNCFDTVRAEALQIGDRFVFNNRAIKVAAIARDRREHECHHGDNPSGKSACTDVGISSKRDVHHDRTSVIQRGESTRTFLFREEILSYSETTIERNS